MFKERLKLTEHSNLHLSLIFTDLVLCLDDVFARVGTFALRHQELRVVVHVDNLKIFTVKDKIYETKEIFLQLYSQSLVY